MGVYKYDNNIDNLVNKEEKALINDNCCKYLAFYEILTIFRYRTKKILL